MTSGVYTIECKTESKVYIGASRNIEQRWKSHIKMLNKGEHSNKTLQYAYEKYGVNDFVFNIVQPIDRFRMKDAEKEWMYRYGKENIYNIRIPALFSKSIEIIKNFNGLEKIIYDYQKKTGTKQYWIAKRLNCYRHRWSFLKKNPKSMNPDEVYTFAKYFEVEVEEFIRLISAPKPESTLKEVIIFRP